PVANRYLIASAVGRPSTHRPLRWASGNQYQVAESPARETRASRPYALCAKGFMNGEENSMVMVSAERRAFSSTARHVQPLAGMTMDIGVAPRFACSDTVKGSNRLEYAAASASPEMVCGVISGCVVRTTSTAVSAEIPSSCIRVQKASSTPRGTSVHAGAGGGGGAVAHEPSRRYAANGQLPTVNTLIPVGVAVCSSPRKTRGF